MLQQFSWGHFLIASIVLNLVWYGFVLLVFYWAEVLAFFEKGSGGGVSFGRGVSGARARHLSQALNGSNEDKRIEREVDDALMGSSRLPDGVEVKSSAQVSFSASEDDGRYDQVGLVADVVQDLKVIFSALESSGGSKAEFMRRVSELREDYGDISGHPSLGAINGFIRERALFPISDSELAEVWY